MCLLRIMKNMGFPENIRSTPCDRALPSQPISIRNAQLRKKSPDSFAHFVNFSKNVSAMFDNQRICRMSNFHVFLLRDLRFVLCSRDLDVLRAQRIIGFLILITHKSARLENTVTWLVQWRSAVPKSSVVYLWGWRFLVLWRILLFSNFSTCNIEGRIYPF